MQTNYLCHTTCCYLRCLNIRVYAHVWVGVSVFLPHIHPPLSLSVSISTCTPAFLLGVELWNSWDLRGGESEDEDVMNIRPWTKQAVSRYSSAEVELSLVREWERFRVVVA